MTKVDPTSNGVPPFTIKVASFFLFFGLLFFPFAIAVSNFFFACLLITALFYRNILKQGWQLCWQEYKPLTVAVLLFIGITCIGTLWSEFNALAVHKIGKQINWLFVFVITGLVCFNPSLRVQAFITISIALTIHLIICTLQYFGMVTINGLGSNAGDAAGFFGHLSLGFIYGIWSGALLVAATSMRRPWQILCYTLATYAVITVYLAQGRSGYITTFACLALVIFKVFFPQNLKPKLIILSVLILGLGLFASNYQPTQEKIQRTVTGVSSFFDGHWENVDMRIKIWLVSIQIWQDNPFFGVGTAGYPDAAKQAFIDHDLSYLHLTPNEKKVFYGHPHNEFLFALSRWGPIGLLILIYLCWQWVRTGWKKDWQHDAMNAYLLTASGISVILHGLTEPSLNTHYETVFAILVLGFGLSSSKQDP